MNDLLLVGLKDRIENEYGIREVYPEVGVDGEVPALVSRIGNFMPLMQVQDERSTVVVVVIITLDS
jgi:hypothetical protein